MASGLQCPGCGHVHPAGLPEIARGDATFRCYGCYRMLSVPEGWTGRAAARQPAPGLAPTEGAPPGAGSRDARSARLAGRRGRGAALTRSGPAAPGGDATQMVPSAGPDDGMAVGPGDAHAGWPTSGAAHAGTVGAYPGSVPGRDPDGATGAWPAAGLSGDPGATTGRPSLTEHPGSARADAAPLGWVSRRSATTVTRPIRVLVWMLAFGVGLLMTAVLLRKTGLLDVNTAIDLYAGSGIRRFGILLVMLPLWALLSATIAHFSLEALAKRRRGRRPAATTRRPQGNTSTPG